MSRTPMDRFRQFAGIVAAAGIATVFLLFVIGIGMRYLAHRPLAWIDEAVTLITVWSTFWTAAFVLRWPEFIAFDVVFSKLSPAGQRLSLLIVAGAFILLMGAALPGLVDYTLFLWRERTDAMQLRLDAVFAVFPAFILVIGARLALTVARLAGAGWRDELARWNANPDEAAR